MSTDDEALGERTLREVLSYLLHESWDKTTPEMGTNVHRIVKKITGNRDPYEKLKRQYNEMASNLYPKLKKVVESSEDSLLTAVKVAIAGNSIDFGPRIKIDLGKEVQRVLNSELSISDIDEFKKSLRRVEEVLYLADNAGETFFDRILIEELMKMGINVTYVVKGAPILNDATLQDAEAAGITKIARVISTGTDCTGILLKECSREFLEEFRRSKMIISKGQGNYESLNDIKNKEIFFLLKVKCPIVARIISVEVGSTILKRVFNRG